MAVLSDAARRALYDAGVSQAGFQVQLAKVLPSMNKLLADIGDLRKGISNFTGRMKQACKWANGRPRGRPASGLAGGNRRGARR